MAKAYVQNQASGYIHLFNAADLLLES